MIPMDFPFITNKKIFSYAKNKISFTNNISSTARTPPNHAPIAVSTFAPNVEPDTPDTNTLVKLSSFHV